MSFFIALAAAIMTPSAAGEAPPSPEKQKLIAEFLDLTGISGRISSASLMDVYAASDGGRAMMANAGPDGAYHGDLIDGPMGLVLKAYKDAFRKHADDFRKAYAAHVNWEFTDGELRQINGFLSSKVGRHYLEGEWRMRAYVGTDTEDLTWQVAAEAKAAAKKLLADKGFESPSQLDLTIDQIRAAEGAPNAR